MNQSDGKHETLQCSCGIVIQTCKCYSAEKTITVVEKGCWSCKGR